MLSLVLLILAFCAKRTCSMKFWTVPYLGSMSLLLVLPACLIGCGGSGDGYTGPRGTVSGTVTFDGNPVPPESTVMFQSKVGTMLVATGTIKEGGKYELAYNGEKDVPAVSYLVQISPPPQQGAGPSTPVAADPKAAKAFTAADVKKFAADAKNTKFPFPAKYHSVNTSKLTFDVKDGSNTADFKLEK